MSLIDRYYPQDEDEEEKKKRITPSQVAGVEQKRKGSLIDTYYPAKIEREPEPEPKKPKIIERVKGFFKGVADFVLGKKKIKDRTGFKEEFGIVPESVPDEPHSYFDYHALSTIPVLQKRVNEIDVKQDQRLTQGRATSAKLQKERDRLNELIGLDNNRLGTVLKRTNEARKIYKSRARRGVAAGAIDVADSFADAVSWLGRDIPGIEKTAKKTSDKIEQWSDYIRPEQPEFVDKLAQGVGSALTFYIPGVGVAKGVNLFAKVSPALALFFGGSAAAALESASEAGTVYEENVETGKSKDTAAEKASNTFWANVVLVGITNRLGVFGDSATRLKRVLASAGFEGLQEYAQQAISNVNTGREWDEGTIESGIIGAIIGGGMGSIDITEGQAVAIVPEPEAEVIRKPVEPEPVPSVPESITPETILYHGTTTKLATAIKEGKIEVTKDTAATYGAGVYLSDNAEVAKDYGKAVVPIKPTKELKLYAPNESELTKIRGLFGGEQMDYIFGLLGKEFDGLVVPERAGDGNEIVIYDSSLLSITEPTKPPAKKLKGLTAKTELLVSHEGAPDKALVESVKKQIQAGEEISPILVVREGEKYGVEDGKHKFQAFKELGIEEVPIKLVEAKKPPVKKPVLRVGNIVETTKDPITGKVIRGEIIEKPVSPKFVKVKDLKTGKVRTLRAQFIVSSTKPPEPRRAPKKPKKAKPPTKPGKIEVRKVKKPKAKIFRVSARKQLQQEIAAVVISGKTQEESVRNVDKFLANTFNQADDPLYERKLKAIRAELKREMYDLVGATTGNFKRDYAFFQRTRDNPDFVELIDRMEEGIFQIDEIINPTVSAPEGLATTGSKPVGEFEIRTEPRKGTNEFKLFEKTKELTRKYAKIIGVGYTPRNALGVYFPKTKNIFVNALNDLSTVSHEITHFLDKTYNISDKLLAIKGFAVNGNPIYNSQTLKYRKAITDLYIKYYAGGKKTHKLRKRALEGFATLLQKYVEMPQTITEEYPLLVNSFLKKGGRYYHPVMGEIIKDLNEIVKEYQGLSALDKVGSRVVTEDAKVDKPSFLNFRDRLRSFMTDEIYPTEILAKRSGRHFTKADPSLWLRAYNNVSGIVNNNINGKRGYWTFVKGDIKKIHDFNWKTLHKTLETRKNTDDFNYYLVSRREHFSYKELDVLKEKFESMKKIAKGMTARQARDTIDAETGQNLLEQVKAAGIKYLELKELLNRDGFARGEVDKAYLENKDRFTEEEKIFDVLTREDLKFLSSEEVQLITPKQLEELTSKQGYASFKRQFYNEVIGENNEIPIQTRVGRNKISSLLRRRGSQQAIISPLTSAITNHSEILRKGLRQVVYNKITDIGVSAAFPNIFQDLQLKVSVDPKTGALFYPQEKDPSIIMGRLDYKRKPVLVDAKIKNVLDNVLTYRNVDTFARLYTGLSRLFTAGTTGYYPPFAVVNLLRDQITAQANTVNKYKTLYSPIKAFGKMLQSKNSEEYGFYEEYLVMGGERQTFTGWQKLPPDKLAQRIRDEKSGIRKTILLMEKGTDILSAPAKYSEIITRATEYINARKAGKPTIVALEEAGRLTAPFHHLGSWGGRHGQIFIRGIPYFNAQLQVLDQHARVATTPDGRRRMLVVLTAITAAYITSMMALLDADDEQKEQYKDLKPEELARYLYFPHPSGKKLIRIPMSEVFTPAGTIINMVIADEVLKAKYTQSDYIHAATAILPDQFDPTEPKRAFLSWMPQVFKTGIEAVVGVKTYPEVTPLESTALKNLPPELRTKRNTSRFAKWLGKKIKISPVKIDYLITGYAGRGINIALGKPDAWNFEGSVLREYWFSNGRRVSGTYDLREGNDQKYNAYQNKKIELGEDERDEVYRVKMLTNEFIDLMREFREADIEEDEQKAAELRTEIIILINKIETGERPKGFAKWKRQAKKRRKKKKD